MRLHRKCAVEVNNGIPLCQLVVFVPQLSVYKYEYSFSSSHNVEGEFTHNCSHVYHIHN